MPPSLISIKKYIKNRFFMFSISSFSSSIFTFSIFIYFAYFIYFHFFLKQWVARSDDATQKSFQLLALLTLAIYLKKLRFRTPRNHKVCMERVHYRHHYSHLEESR